ncbi:MAG: ATPase [Micrococcales bacterium]|nr:MAG: ATPase [Micrococcales bacterium]
MDDVSIPEDSAPVSRQVPASTDPSVPERGQHLGAGTVPEEPGRPGAPREYPEASGHPDELAPPDPDLARDDVSALRAAGQQVRTVVVGQEAMVDRLLIATLARGHCLLEGVPGVAKTLAVRTFAVVLGGSFARLQFTPDLVPSDIIGTRIYKPSTESFDVELGPVFVNFVLADEVNRAPAKVQAAMLELMAEHQVSLGGVSYQLPDPFTVIATQNPLESEGVYPLPEAQRDRFLLKVDVPLPRAHEEAEILRRMSVRPPIPEPVLDPERVVRLQRAADEVYVHPLITDYAVRLVMATRSPQEYGLPGLAPIISGGASPRATLGLVAAARAMALIQGRDHVLPEDLQVLAVDVIAHRLLLGFDAVADGINARDIVGEVVHTVPPPRPS